jgi:hypothetical protein
MGVLVNTRREHGATELFFTGWLGAKIFVASCYQKNSAKRIFIAIDGDNAIWGLFF